MDPTPEELQAQAAAIREEVKGLEATVAGSRRPKEVVESQQAEPLPRTLLDSCWRVVMEIRGVKDAKNRVPVRLTFCTKFSSDDNILLVEQGHRFIKRGFVWEPERNPKDGRDYITFIAEVEGLSAVPDGRVYLNAYINTIEDEDGTKRYQFSEGAVTIKEVITRSFWGIFNTSGLLAEFKIVGTWDAFPIKDLPLADVASESPPA